MNETYTQFQDLTEIPYIFNAPPLSGIKTEFVFFLKALDKGGKDAKALELGLKPVSSMNNWWPSHNGESRCLTLYWLKLPDRPNCQGAGVKRVRWEYAERGKWTSIKNLAASGCGFKIGEPPLQKRQYYKFFTLMRMPVKIKPIEKMWMTQNHFRLLDTGTMSSYWINGWDPKEYSHEMEYKFFKTSREEWRDHGMDGYDPED
jgi:hypothetical protein